MTNKTIYIIIAIVVVFLAMFWAGTKISSNLMSQAPGGQSLIYTDSVSAPMGASPMSSDGMGVYGSRSSESAKMVADQSFNSVAEEAGDSSRMVIKTGGLSLVVENVSETAKKIVEYVKSKNGWVSNSSVSEDEQVPRGSVTVRVPAENFDEAMKNFRNLAQKVKYETSQGADITEEYVDLESRLRNLNAAEEQLLEIMKRSGKVSDILEVQRELTNVRAQIEQIKGRMQYLEKSVEMATITVYLALSEDLLPIPPTEKWQPVYVLKKAWHSVLNSLRGISYILIWLITYAIIWAPLVIIGWWLIRRKGRE